VIVFKLFYLHPEDRKLALCKVFRQPLTSVFDIKKNTQERDQKSGTKNPQINPDHFGYSKTYLRLCHNQALPAQRANPLRNLSFRVMTQEHTLLNERRQSNQVLGDQYIRTAKYRCGAVRFWWDDESLLRAWRRLRCPGASLRRNYRFPLE
jgi:hypothetical protein